MATQMLVVMSVVHRPVMNFNEGNDPWLDLFTGLNERQRHVQSNN